MAIEDLLLAYKQQVNTEVSQETQPDTIDPDKVGSIGTDLADILIDFLPQQNKFSVGSGDDFPIGGSDTDMYFRSLSGAIQVIRNIDGVWTVLATIAVGITLPDGILIGLRTSILANVVTVSDGAWSIDNIKFSKDTQTQFTLEPKDISFDRWDLIWADKDALIRIVTGTPSLVPVKPEIPIELGGPDYGITVDYVYVPAIGQPYLLTGQPTTITTATPLEVSAAMQDADGIYTLLWNDSKVTQYGTFGRFQVEQMNTYQEVPIKINKDINTNLPISYEFNLSNIDTLIHII